VTVIVWPEPRLPIDTTPTAVHVVAVLGKEAERCARSFWLAVVVTAAPPPSRTFPAGQMAAAVTVVLRGAFDEDVTGFPVTSVAPAGPAAP
jgi:hypothetical protein